MRKPVIVNIRGTSGSGKSTIVRSIMSLYPAKEAKYVPERKQPLYYILSDPEQPERPKLAVIGHYESSCGGADTISKYMTGVLQEADEDHGDPNSYDLIFGLVKELYDGGHDVLFEGLLITGDIKRAKDLKASGYPLHIISLTLPIELCIESVKARRAAKGNENEFNEANTREKHELQIHCVTELKKLGVEIDEPTTREEALLTAALSLGFSKSPEVVHIKEEPREKKPPKIKKVKVEVQPEVVYQCIPQSSLNDFKPEEYELKVDNHVPASVGVHLTTHTQSSTRYRVELAFDLGEDISPTLFAEMVAQGCIKFGCMKPGDGLSVVAAKCVRSIVVK